ncbi:hypothetical protein CVT24_010491 [Panaeolus cyanescens]|uniref:RRM domain-containing protein n=1 Tax=Panaeolus cyanescens TaxID=181874 RepID=A0A409YLU6_9AGAR|nr:hypothetical protein CVT24_010491 [Panaeolus cyanescens]
MYGETNPTVDPYSDAYNAPPQPAPETSERDAPRGRSRSRSPVRRDTNGANGDSGRYRSPPPRRRSPPPPRRSGAIKAPIPSHVLGVFGLSIRTQERDLEDEFSRFGRVEKVTIVYDQRSDRSRGFGFIQMGTVEEATKCIQELNGMELNGRKIRVDYSVTDRPHNPTPGEYMGHRRARDRDDRRDHRDSYRDSYRDRRDRDRDRDYYGRDRDRDWRDRRSPPPRSSRYSPEYSSRRRRSYSRSPPPRGSSPPPRKSNGDGPANGSSERW